MVQWLNCLPLQGLQVWSLLGELRFLHALGPKKQNIKQKWYCNKSNKAFKDVPHFKKYLKNIRNKTKYPLFLFPFSARLFQRTFILLAPSLSAWPLPKSLQATEVTPFLLPLLHQNSCNQGGLWWSSFCWILWSHGWTVKKAERRRIDAFELWCWRTLLRVPWTARRSNQS